MEQNTYRRQMDPANQDDAAFEMIIWLLVIISCLGFWGAVIWIFS